MTANEPREIVRADPALRRTALIVVAVLVVIVAGTAASAPRMLRSVSTLSQASPTEAVLLFAAFILPVLAIAVVGGLDTGRRSLRTLRGRRFPPRGMRVLRDTPVIEGNAARALGVLGCALGAMLLVASGLLAVTSYRIAAVLWYGCPKAAAVTPPA